MTKSELEKYREHLMALGQRLKGNFASLEREAFRANDGAASGNLSNTPLHLGDLSADAFEEEVSLGLLENQEQRLEEIGDAIERIDQGTYGRCQECGQDIGAERLRALPYAPLCVECARREQARIVQIENPGNL